MYRGLCLSIGTQSSVRLQTLIRPGKDDRAPSLLLHQGNRCLAGVHVGKEVERESVLPVFCCELLKPLRNEEANVGHQDIDAIPESGEDLCDTGFDPLFGTQVCHRCTHADRWCSLPTQFIRQARKPFLVEIKQREVGARPDKCPCDCRADATGCTGDAHHLSCQFLRSHCSAPSLVLKDTL